MKNKIISLFVVALVLTACSNNQEKFQLISDEGSNQVIPVRTDEASGFDALLEGKLAIDGEGCLGILSAPSGFSPVIWPLGTEIEQGIISIKEKDPRTVVIGEDIYLGGGSLKISSEDLDKLPKCFANYQEAFWGSVD